MPPTRQIEPAINRIAVYIAGANGLRGVPSNIATADAIGRVALGARDGHADLPARVDAGPTAPDGRTLHRRQAEGTPRGAIGVDS